MGTSVPKLITAIAAANNRYRERERPPCERLEALWDIGNQLFLQGVESPHSVGWVIQRETRGLIKRPTIFRSHKVRSIWQSKVQLSRDLGGITGLSVLTEMLPLIDPAQAVRQRLSSVELSEIFHHAVHDSPGEFKTYAAQVKARFASGRLGKPLNREKHLGALRRAILAFNKIFEVFATSMLSVDCALRDELRQAIPSGELKAFGNMCLALTTKDNMRLYKRIGPDVSAAAIPEFKLSYDTVRRALNKTSDVERARLRRLLHADVLARTSDMVSSLGSEEAVVDFRARQSIAIRL